MTTDCPALRLTWVTWRWNRANYPPSCWSVEQFVGRGMIADFAIHQPDKEDGGIPNPHFHVLCRGRRDNRLSRAPLDLGDVKVKQGQLSALLLVNGAAHQGGTSHQNYLICSVYARPALLSTLYFQKI